MLEWWGVDIGGKNEKETCYIFEKCSFFSRFIFWSLSLNCRWNIENYSFAKINGRLPCMNFQNWLL